MSLHIDDMDRMTLLHRVYHFRDGIDELGPVAHRDLIRLAKDIPVATFQEFLPGYANENSPFYHWYLELRGTS